MVHCTPGSQLVDTDANGCGGRCVKATCFRPDTKYINPLDMPGQGRTSEVDAVACQHRCAKVRGCAHFSFWADGGCHLQPHGAVSIPSPLPFDAKLSGPPVCRSDIDDGESVCQGHG